MVTEEASAPVQHEAATSAGSSDAGQRNPDVDSGRPEEASAVAQDEATSAGSSHAGQRNSDVDNGPPEEASAETQDETKDLAPTVGSPDAGMCKPDVDVLAKGIASVLGPVMNSFDGGVEGVLKSQSILASSIDRLTRELDKLLEDVPHPYATHHATRLSGIRKRVIALNTSLRIIQTRMEMIQRFLAGYASRTAAASGKALVKGFHSTFQEIPRMEVLPYEVSCRVAEGNSNDIPLRVEDSEMSILSGKETLQDDSGQAKEVLKKVSPHRESSIDREPGATSIARDKDLDVKGD